VCLVKISIGVIKREHYNMHNTRGDQTTRISAYHIQGRIYGK